LNVAAGGNGTPGHIGGFAELPGLLSTPVVTEALKNDTGTLSNDHITKDPTLTGSGDPYAVVSFSVDGLPLATTTSADSLGNWTFKPTGLADGQHTVIASETNGAGNTGTASLTFMLDTTPPAVTEALNKDTGSSSTDHITNDPTLTGSGDPNAVVHFTVDGVAATATATADNSGHWTFLPTGLSDGQHTAIASETDAAGNTGTASLTFMLDTTPPIDQITSDTLNKNNSFTISGTSEKGAAVKIFDGASLLGSTVPDANGHWVFTTQSLSSTSVHTFTSTATDVAGNVASTGAAIYGTASNDTLYSTPANDILTGGSGADTFVFSKAAFGKDTITDFASTGAGHDVLQFDHSIFATNATALAHATQVGSNVVVAYDAADTITLVGVSLHQLSANDFHII
jgi:Ca2+-binding RTX toxin-like protein